MRLWLWPFLMICLLVPARVWAEPTPAGATSQSTSSSTAPAADFDVQEWVVLIADAYQPQANSAATVDTTLPTFIDTRRRRAPATQQSRPSPIGVIRLIGRSNAKVDVKLQIPAGRVMASWPKASTRAGSVLWRDLSLEPEGSRLEAIDAKSWLNSLRAGSSAFMTADGHSERFLLYDVELNYALPLKLGGGADHDDAIDLANIGAAPIHDVVLYRPDTAGDGWRSARLTDLPPGRKLTPASGPSTSPATTAPTTIASTAPATAATNPAAVIALKDIDPADVRHVRLAATPSTQPADFLGEWRARLTSAGLGADDLDLIVKILEVRALDTAHLTAVYRLDDGELDRLLPLEVLPQPRKTVRVGLVMVRNADPAIPAQIAALVAQLGDRDWRKREQATQALSQLGAGAKAELQIALKSNDPEIVLRAERLLKSLEKE